MSKVVFVLATVCVLLGIFSGTWPDIVPAYQEYITRSAYMFVTGMILLVLWADRKDG